MQRTYRSMSLMLAAALALTACGHDAPPAQSTPPTASAATAPAAAPVIVNAPPAQSGMTELLTGGALGYLLGKSSSGGHAAPAPSSTTVHKTIVHQTVVPATPAAPAAVLPPATPKPASTTAVTLSKPAPSYAPRSAYASTSGSSAYRAAAAPARTVTTTAPSYARSYTPPATYSGRR